MPNAGQAEHWNSSEQVARWVTHQEEHDRMLGPLSGVLLGAAALAPGEAVLDVGCGCGDTTLAAARAVAPGAVVGVDLSAPMLARARDNAAGCGLPNVSFRQGDAQVHGFGQAFDAVISRLGIMFFADPVAAFANLRGAARPRGRLTFVCWQSMDANEWLAVAAAALSDHVAPPEPPDAGAPGMFAFADPARIRQVLGAAGWQQVSVTSQELPILVGGGLLDDAVAFLRTGTLGRTMLEGADAVTQARAIRALRAALARRAGPDGVLLGAALWLVQAVA